MSGPEWWSPDESEVSKLLAQTNWAETAFGPREAWPKVLLNAVQLLIDLPTSAILFWGQDKLQIYNDGYIEIMGPRHPKYFGAPYRECWPDTYPHINPWMERVLETGDVLKIEKAFFAVTRHGFYEEAFFTFTFSPLRDERGVIRGIFQPCIEVTETVLAERRAETLHALSPRLDSNDPAKDVIEALLTNPHDVPFALVFGWDAAEQRLEQIAATPGIVACPAAAAELQRAARRAAHSSAPVVVEDLTAALEGRHIGPWEATAKSALVLPMRRTDAAVPRGVVVFGLSSALQFDDRYRGFLEVAASQVTSAIEGASALREARERAEALAELDRAKTAFFSNVSHEFRTPLTLMLGPTEDALHSAEPRLQGDQLEMLYRNELRLLKLVNTLLDFSRVEAGSIQTQLAPTDLPKLTRDFADAFRPAIERAGLAFQVKCEALPSLVLVDPAMWEKIVMNLLSNALKFTFEGSIGLSLVERGEDIELCVRDTGTGIPAAELPHMFKRFHRVSHARSRTHEGSGIGLALVHELCKVHGGGVSVSSTLGKGTAFTVRLPLRASRQTEYEFANAPATSLGVGAYTEEASRWSPQAREGARQLQKPSAPPLPSQARDNRASDDASKAIRILVADDNADMREYLGSLLSQRFTVECVTDGQAALDSVLRTAPDLVISDVMMPSLDGFGLVRTLRADPRTAALPIIMLSARAGEEATVEGIELGADDYLVKPFSARELFARVGARLEIHRLNQGLERKVQERTAQLTESNRELESFSYSVSHDLRAPLRHIVGFAQLLERGSADRLDEKAKGQLTIIREAAERGGQLVDDLLAFSRLGRAEVAKRHVDLARIVSDVRGELASEMGDGHVVWDVGPLPGVEADAALLRLVVKNLLSNAIKYSRPKPTGPERHAHVRVRAEERANEVEVWVKDDGVGFDMAYVDNLFGVFQRLHSSREFEGTGIGLAHVRRIVLKHGGRTWAEGELGKGATFHFTLPRKAQPHGS